MAGSINCIGIIPDGNRRWAKAKGLPKLEGHRAGVETIKEVIQAASELEIKHIAVWIFSTENWARESEEVSYLMNLFLEVARTHARELAEEDVRIRFVGQEERFSPELRVAIDDIEKESADKKKITLWLCLSYGGRAEIVRSVEKVLSAGEKISEETIAKYLWTAEMPEPDIIIRTSGEKRLSGFLTWCGIYSELFFSDTLWPEFRKEELEKIIAEYRTRERRMGR